MSRFIRKTVILAKIESVYGTDSTPTGSANALVVSNLSITPINANNVARDIIREAFGASQQLVGTYYVEMGFDVEIQGSGTAGTAPAWGPLLRACGFAEAVTASTRVDYTPITDSPESMTIYWYDDGVLHKATGCFGNAEIKMGVGERPVYTFRFLGLYNAVSAASNPSTTLTAWKVPEVVNNANTDGLLIGCSYSAGALSGGTEYARGAFSLNLGNQVNFTALVGGETIDISQREVSGSVTLDLTASQEATFAADVLANTTSAMGFVHGTTSGLKTLLFMPAVQLVNYSKQEINGKRLIGYDMRAIPVSGNDELRIVSL